MNMARDHTCEEETEVYEAVRAYACNLGGEA